MGAISRENKYFRHRSHVPSLLRSGGGTGLSNPGIGHFAGYFQDIVKTVYSGFPGGPPGGRQEGRQEAIRTLTILNILNKTHGVLNLAS